MADWEWAKAIPARGKPAPLWAIVAPEGGTSPPKRGGLSPKGDGHRPKRGDLSPKGANPIPRGGTFARADSGSARTDSNGGMLPAMWPPLRSLVLLLATEV